MRVETNFKLVEKALLKKLANLSDADKILRTAMFDATALIVNRVQQDGENAEGQKMVSKAKIKKGAYSEKYSEFRTRKGRETDHIDLTFTGDMINSFLPEPINKGYGIGFRGGNGKLSYDTLVSYNELRFGLVFVLSDSEKTFIRGLIAKNINEALNG